ncbi:MAG TPA: carbon storage regulator [Humisphaera sp.]|nr:carbon storage regulator [Humisphaera sp.]
MLVLSRETGTSIVVKSADETCVITLLKIATDRTNVSILINRAMVNRPGDLETRTVQVELNCGEKIGAMAEMWLVDVRVEKVRLGIIAPRQSSVHRLEVYQAIQNENRGPGDEADPDRDSTGSPVPRPSAPLPPSLDVRLDEPQSDEDDPE